MSKIENVKRITVNRVFGDLEHVKKLTWIGRVSFYVVNILYEESPHGKYPRFVGELKFVDTAKNHTFISGNGVFPAPLSEVILAVKTDKAANITGIYDLGVEPHDGHNRYVVKAVIEAADRPVLDLLEAAHAKVSE